MHAQLAVNCSFSPTYTASSQGQRGTFDVTQRSSRLIFPSFTTFWIAPPTPTWLPYLLSQELTTNLGVTQYCAKARALASVTSQLCAGCGRDAHHCCVDVPAERSNTVSNRYNCGATRNSSNSTSIHPCQR